MYRLGRTGIFVFHPGGMDFWTLASLDFCIIAILIDCKYFHEWLT